jgi:GNAT superfamily N-acetyltransferase
MSERAVTPRRAVESDRTALAQMLARCSSQTRYRRFHGHVSAFPARFLTEALAGTPVHFALVGDPGDGSVVAFANCRTVAPGVAEVGVLVEDAYQRLGIGAALLREMAGYARWNGVATLTAQVLADQGWITRLLGGYGACDSVISRGVLDVTVLLDADPRASGQPPHPRAVAVGVADGPAIAGEHGQQPVGAGAVGAGAAGSGQDAR